jgi:hypothetical protein
MQSSENLNELAAALAKAQGEITGALKDSANPFFKSKYADLASCWDACRGPLSANGLSVVQATERGQPVTIEWETTNQETAEVSKFKVDTVELVVVTMLLHASGQWIKSHLPMIPRDASPQGMGSALTYGRRYGFAAIVGVAQVDDDGNQASGRGAPIKEIHSPKGNAVQNVAMELARKHALAMLAIIAAPAKDGDHDELQKALAAYDYHQQHLIPNSELYIAAAEQMEPHKRTVWKALISKAKTAEAADRAVSGAGKRF